MKNTIIELEEKLRFAMIESDIAVLEDLIDDSLIFIAPNGDVITKEMDIFVHKNKLQTINQIEVIEQNINIKENIAVVTTEVNLCGNYDKNDISGVYRYLRVWVQQKNLSEYRIIAGSVTIIK